MTIAKFLEKQMKQNKVLKTIINDSYKEKSVEEFFQKFGKMDEVKMAEFFLKGENAFKLGLWANGTKGTLGGHKLSRYDSNGRRYGTPTGLDKGLDEK